MKNILVIFLVLISFAATAQGKKLIKFQSEMERCLDPLGDPIEDCFVLSNSAGKFTKRTLEYVLNKLNVANAGAVDSIYTSGDTLYVVYFNAPTLAYKAMGLNGLFSPSNQGKNLAVTGALYNAANPTLAFVAPTGTNVGRVQFNGFGNAFNTYAQAGEGYTLYSFASASAGNYIGMTANGRTWKFGASAAGHYNIMDRTSSVTPFQIQFTPTVVNTLQLQSDGDILMGDYTSARPFSTNPLNFAGWDALGTMQMYELQDLIDTIQGIEGAMFQLDITLDDADIQGMFATPIVIIPGEAGKVVRIIAGTAVYRYGTIPYTNGGTIRLADEGAPINSISQITGAFSMSLSQDHVSNFVQQQQYLPTEGTGVVITNTNNGFTNGDGTLRLIIKYEMVDTQ